MLSLLKTHVHLHNDQILCVRVQRIHPGRQALGIDRRPRRRRLLPDARREAPEASLVVRAIVWALPFPLGPVVVRSWVPLPVGVSRGACPALEGPPGVEGDVCQRVHLSLRRLVHCTLSDRPGLLLGKRRHTRLLVQQSSSTKFCQVDFVAALKKPYKWTNK